jgi:hypothetical protein
MTIEEQNNIIRILKEVDGETIQYILEKIGMDDQMCHQLMMSFPFIYVLNNLSERCELEISLIKK